MGEFFKKAFTDMKESTGAQHEVDKANFAAARAESKANFVQAKAMSKPENYKKIRQAELEKEKAQAEERIKAAEERIERIKSE